MAYMAFYKNTLSLRESKVHVLDADSGEPWCGATHTMGDKHRVPGPVSPDRITCKACARKWEEVG